jgi:superfamily II DNA or RNA helicase
MSGIVLRDYQHECVEAVEGAVARGVGSQLAVLPTGGGKTIVFSEIVRRRSHKPVLILAHRDELLQQAADKLVSVAPELGMQIGMVKANRNDVGAPIVIGSVQTLARPNRLAQLPPGIGTLIVDEGHHALADSYRKIIDHCDAELTLLVTATPKRGDGRSLEEVVDELVFAKDLLWMIEQGYLCPPKGKRIEIDVDLSKVKKSRGDFQSGDLAEALEKAGAPAEVLAAYEEHGEGRKSIVFAPTVEMAYHLADVFKASGHAAEAVDGETPKEERDRILHRFHNGETKVLCNVEVLTEGYDEPSVECIILARPTKSEALYTQIIGRGLRLYPGKSDCLILDVAGASDDKSIQSLPALFGLGKLMEGEDVLEAIARERDEAQAVERQARTDREEERDELAERRRRNAESIKFFSRDRMNWAQIDEKWTIAFDRDRTIVLWPMAGERYDVLLVTATFDRTTRQRERSYRHLARGLDFGYAQGTAEESIRRYGKPLLADSKAAWREDDPSQGQVRNLKRLRLPIPETKGEASDLLSEANLAEDLEALEGVLLDEEAREAVAA